MSFAVIASAGLIALSLQASGPAGSDSTIAVQELGDIHPFEVDAGGRLPETVWSSGEIAPLRAALAALPTSDKGWVSQEAARLALTTLLSGGEPVERTGDRFELSPLRVGRALAIGKPQPVHRLLERTPRINESEPLSRLYAELSFGLGLEEAACEAANALLDGRDGAYWLRARAACLAFAGNIPAAELTAELARAQTPNPNFDLAIDAFTLGRDLPEGFAPNTGLELALAEALAPDHRLIPGPEAPLWLDRAAERTGPAISLPETLPEALEAAVAMEGEARKVALGALIQQDLDRTIAAEALAIRLTDAAASNAFVDVASAYGMEVARLPITADTLANGRLFSLAALAADDIVAAARWREALFVGPPRPAPQPIDDPALQAGVDGPSSLAVPPGFAQGVADEAEAVWSPPPASVFVELEFASAVAEGLVRDDTFAPLLAARLEGATPARLCQAALLITVGADDGGDLRAALAGLNRDGANLPASFVPGLLAASAQSIGESALLAVLTLNGAPDQVEACAGAGAILSRAGLEREALRLALELILEEAA